MSPSVFILTYACEIRVRWVGSSLCLLLLSRFLGSIAAIGPGIRLQDVQKGGGLTSLQKRSDHESIRHARCCRGTYTRKEDSWWCFFFFWPWLADFPGILNILWHTLGQRVAHSHHSPEMSLGWLSSKVKRRELGRGSPVAQWALLDDQFERWGMLQSKQFQEWLIEIWKCALVFVSYFWYVNDLVLCRTLKTLRRTGGCASAQIPTTPLWPRRWRGWKVTSLPEHWWPVSGALFVGWIFSSVRQRHRRHFPLWTGCLALTLALSLRFKLFDTRHSSWHLSFPADGHDVLGPRGWKRNWFSHWEYLPDSIRVLPPQD